MNTPHRLARSTLPASRSLSKNNTPYQTAQPSAAGSFNYAYKAFFNNWGAFTIVTLVCTLTALLIHSCTPALNLVLRQWHLPTPPTGLQVGAVAFLLIWVSLAHATAITAGTFDIMDGKTTSPSSMFARVRPHAIICLILAQLTITAAVWLITLCRIPLWCLLAIPFLLMFSAAATAEKFQSPGSAILHSVSIVTRNTRSCIYFALIACSIMAIGLALAALPAIFISWPIVEIAGTHYYRSISKTIPSGQSQHP